MKKYRICEGARQEVCSGGALVFVRVFSLERRVWLFLWDTVGTFSTREASLAALKMLNESRIIYGDEK